MNASQEPEKTQPCPVCQASVPFSPRYAAYLCPLCASQAVDESGRKLVFHNLDFAGGFAAEYADTGEPRESHVCFVQGIRCWADEARFGGIVIQPANREDDAGPPNPP